MHTYVTIKGTSAAMASSMLAAATGGLVYGQLMYMASEVLVGGAYGTKMAVAVAWVSLTASATFLKTGRLRCCVPAFLGFVPPTTLVPVVPVSPSSRAYHQSCVLGRIPYSIACCAWKLSLF